MHQEAEVRLNTPEGEPEPAPAAEGDGAAEGAAAPVEEPAGTT
jgi:hypothetical protein